MINVEIPSREVCSSQVGKAFAKADDFDQAYFLMSFVKEIEFGKWAMQCSYIANSIAWNPPHNIDRETVIIYLECLIEHLKDFNNKDDVK